MLNDFELMILIENSIKTITKRLELTTPKITFNEIEGIGYLQYNKSINIPLKDLEKAYKNWDLDLCPLKIVSYLNRIYFILIHEVGHYFQHCKFPLWYKKYSEQKHNTKWKSSKEYANTKLEKNATKIACILYRKWKNERL